MRDEPMWQWTNLVAHLLLVPVFLLGMAQLKNLVPWFNSNWRTDAHRRALWLVKNDCAAQLHPQPNVPIVTVVLGVAYFLHYIWPAVYLIVLLLKHTIAGCPMAVDPTSSDYELVGRLDKIQECMRHANLDEATSFVRMFVVSNLVYLSLQVCLPVSPPWKLVDITDNYGKRVDRGSHVEAGLVRFDQLIGRKICAKIYESSHWFDGSFPSGHVLWTSLILLHAGASAPGEEFYLLDRAVWGFAWLHFVAVFLAALHTAHHFFVDCLAALLLAVLVFGLVRV
jgi:hypothetical protein